MSREDVRVLIIESSPEDLDLYRNVLAGAFGQGSAFWETDSGEVGLNLSALEDPDCILLDASLPDMNGLQFLSRLIGQGNGTLVPVLILTGPGNEKTAVEAMKLGAADWVVKDPEGQFAAFLPLVIERLVNQKRLIIENRQAQEALLESKERLEAILNTVQVGIAVIDAQSCRIEQLNPAAARLIGLPGQEIVGRKCHELFCADLTGPCPVADLGQVIQSTESLLQTINRTRIPVLRNATAVSLGGRKYVIASFIDIAERKRAEEALRASEAKYRELSDSLPEAVFETDGEGRFTFLNRTGLDKLGYTEADLERGLNLFALLVPEDRDRAREGLSQRKPGQAPEDGEYTLLCRDGRPLPVLIQAAPVLREGRLLGLRGIAQDLTEQRRIESERKFMEARLRQAQKMEAIGTLAGGIAHDFNNILAAIIGYAELTLADIPPQARYRNSIEQVIKAGERASDLVKQILSFSRQTEHERRPIEIRPVVKETLKLLRASLPSTIEIRNQVSAKYSPVLADPTQIHQVLMNLCTNAAQAMKDQGGLLTVELDEVHLGPEAAGGPELKPGRYLRLTVSDTGPGIDPAIIERIFEPYFTTKKPGEGTGMGLAVVHGIVKSHGGAISVHSQSGQGAAFSVFLPAIEEEPAQEMKTALPLPRGRERILLVDDEAPLVEMGRQLLESLGYRVEASTSSQEALEAFRSKPDSYDLIITDQTMPHLTGMELAKEILKIKPHLPIILCSGFSEDSTQERAEELGIRAVCMKPVVLSELAQTIRTALGRESLDSSAPVQHFASARRRAYGGRPRPDPLEVLRTLRPNLVRSRIR